jgi:hypothetical protein
MTTNLPTCGATADHCVCDKPPSHTGSHHCTRNSCGSQWTGTYGSDDFEVVRLPLEDEYPFGSLLSVLRFGSL